MVKEIEKEMEKENKKEVEVEGTKVNTQTGEVVGEAEKREVEDFDAFAWQRDRDESGESRTEAERKIFYTPHKIQRYTNGSKTKDGKLIYNYATGYFIYLNGKKISQTMDLEPSLKRADTYDLLDAIFGDQDKVQLEVVRSTFNQTVNGRSKTTHTYAFRVSAKTEEGVEISVTLSPTRGNTDKKDNFINKMKFDGDVE